MLHGISLDKILLPCFQKPLFELNRLLHPPLQFHSLYKGMQKTMPESRLLVVGKTHHFTDRISEVEKW